MKIDDIIGIAYLGVSREGGNTLHQAHYTDHGMSDDFYHSKWIDEKIKDTDNNWMDVPDKSLIECDAAIYFLDPISLKYYLPAFMRFAIKILRNNLDHELDYLLFMCNLLNYLIFDKNQPRDEYRLSRFEVLNIEQRKVVGMFLEYVRDYQLKDGIKTQYSGDAKMALLGYWSKC